MALCEVSVFSRVGSIGLRDSGKAVNGIEGAGGTAGSMPRRYGFSYVHAGDRLAAVEASGGRSRRYLHD
jgi:hypothetical protein